MNEAGQKLIGRLRPIFDWEDTQSTDAESDRMTEILENETVKEPNSLRFPGRRRIRPASSLHLIAEAIIYCLQRESHPCHKRRSISFVPCFAGCS